MKRKQKFDPAQLVLRTYAASIEKLEPAYVVVGRYARAEAPQSKGTYDERKLFITAKFDEALADLDNARDTLRVYLGDAIAVALAPDVRVMVKADGAKIGEKASVELTVAKAKRYADIRKLAAAARVKLGVAGKVAGSGKTAAAPAAPTVDTVKTHVQKMMQVAEGRAILAKWAGEVGVWVDFKVASLTGEQVAAQVQAAPMVQVKTKAKRKTARA